ncbi:MAG: ornithine cyclodeaminase family protein [Thermoanaerobaculia bacterium]
MLAASSTAAIMRVLIVSESEVETLLTMEECIGVMEHALASLAREEVHQPLRSIVRPAGARGFLGLMPSYASKPLIDASEARGPRPEAFPLYGLKEVCIFPGNPSLGLDTHLGAVLLHSGETGELLAVMNASAITAIRTAAVSAVATKLLARDDAKTLAIIGAGVQARSHLEAIPLVRKIDRVRVYSRTRARAEQLDAEVTGSVEEAVRDADIVVTATNSKEPILRREWIRPGTHINAVGSSVATAREIDSATMSAASLFVDRRESAVNEGGDYLFALREGAIDERHIRAEIGELLVGSAKGRTSRDEITIFKSLGLAIEDLASAAFIFDKVRRTGGGTYVEF